MPNSSARRLAVRIALWMGLAQAASAGEILFIDAQSQPVSPARRGKADPGKSIAFVSPFRAIASALLLEGCVKPSYGFLW
jgi:hypothetical protein